MLLREELAATSNRKTVFWGRFSTFRLAPTKNGESSAFNLDYLRRHRVLPASTLVILMSKLENDDYGAVGEESKQ